MAILPAMHLTLPRLSAFATPAITIAALGLPIIVFLPPLYAQAGLSLTTVGTIFMLTRIFDVATDPVFGVLGDRLDTRWGRRRTALVASVPVLMLGVWLVFFPDANATEHGLLLNMLILYVGWTMFTLSHTAWAAELSADYNTRSRIMGTIHFFTLLGSIVVLMLPVVLDQLSVQATMRERTALMGWFILLSLPVFTLLAVSTLQEPPRLTTANLPWRSAITTLAGNRPLLWLLAIDLLLGIQSGINGSVHFFFVGQVLGIPQYASIYLVVIFVTGLLFVPLFMRMSYRIGKHPTAAIAVFITAVGTISLFFVPANSFWLTLAVFVFVGVNFGAKDFLMRSMMADVIDQDRVTTGVDRSGLYYAMLTLTAKVGLAASVGIIYPMLDMVGFDPAGANDEATLRGVRIVVATSPTLLLFLAAALIWRFPLDRQAQEKLRATLAARQGS
ncbi:MAG: MFS transporter [Pseudomonadales bacterium]|nr:MFS transporter [Pseudomonadales bacterium]MCP5185992.1 MFS transporter [Pseudomonadales bacterium]